MAAALLALAACGGGGAAPAVAVERDSAGIPIMENGPPSALPTWRVTDAGLRIGSVDGAGPTSLHRVTGAVRLPDGGLAIANGGSSEVRVFDAAGAHRVTHGRPGSGPGEFRTLMLLAPAGGDTLVAYDASHRRVVVIAAGRGIVRELAIGLTYSGLQAVFADGALLVSSTPAGALEQTDGLVRGAVELRVLSQAGEVVGDVGQHPGAERIVRVSEQRVELLTPPFARRASYSPLGDAVVVAAQEAPEYRIYDRSGELRRIVRTGGAGVPFTQAHLDAHVARLLETVPPEGRASIRGGIEAMPRPDRLPPYGTVVTDRVGSVWVADFPEPGTQRSAWTVHDAHGRAVARVVLPDGTRVFDIGANYIVVLERDELDVEHVRLLSLDRG